MLAPEDAVEKLKCSVCFSYLSHFPIRVSSDNVPICGRCSLPENGRYFQNNIYEALAEFVQFPCRYDQEGCSEVFFPTKIPSHEETCVFKPLNCPTKNFTGCIWNGLSLDRVEHCMNSHSDLILQNGQFQIEPITSTHFNIVPFEDNLVVIRREFNEENNIFRCNVVNVIQGDCDEFIARVSLGDDHDISAKFSVHNGTLKKPNYTVISLESLQKDGKCHVTGEINVSKVDSGTNKIISKDWQCDDFISKFKCSICLKYLSSAVICDGGHVACTTCKNELCPACPTLNSYQMTNFYRDVPLLTALADVLVVPCTYTNVGCVFKDVCSKIIVHQESCQHKPFKCPFRICTWIGPTICVSSHISDSHKICTSQIILNPDRLIYETEYLCALKFSNRIFLARCRYSKSEIIWSVLLVSKPHLHDNFKFEIELVATTGQGQKFCMSCNCGVLLNETQMLPDNEQLKIVRDQLQHMIGDIFFTYKIRIVRRDATFGPNSKSSPVQFQANLKSQINDRHMRWRIAWGSTRGGKGG